VGDTLFLSLSLSPPLSLTHTRRGRERGPTQVEWLQEKMSSKMKCDYLSAGVLGGVNGGHNGGGGWPEGESGGLAGGDEGSIFLGGQLLEKI
jgi:hypothetical protein